MKASSFPQWSPSPGLTKGGSVPQIPGAGGLPPTRVLGGMGAGPVGLDSGNGDDWGGGRDWDGEIKVVPIPVWKRALDLSLALMILPVIGLVGVVVAAWIKLNSEGSVFYWQERMGRGGKRFRMVKFRTMTEDAETAVHEDHIEKLIDRGAIMTKLDLSGDPRIIRGGSTLRATGLDELPQIWNVLRGDMSLVGPRPCMEKEFVRYSPRQRARFSVLPGITGYWQVGGKNRTTFDEMAEMDLVYIEKMSVPFDLSLIAVTVPSIFLGIFDAPLAGPPVSEGVDEPR